MYHAKVPLEVIAKIFGHSDTRTTIRYLGLDHDDMRLAMEQYARYQEGAFVPEEVQIRPEPVKECGGTGITTHENDWLRVDSALDRATRPRGGYGR